MRLSFNMAESLCAAVTMETAPCPLEGRRQHQNLLLLSIVHLQKVSSKKKKLVTSDALGTRLFISVAFVRGCVEEHDGKDVQVPHAVDASEEGAVHLHRVVPPVPVALIHLHPDPRKPAS